MILHLLSVISFESIFFLKIDESITALLPQRSELSAKKSLNEQTFRINLNILQNGANFHLCCSWKYYKTEHKMRPFLFV